MKVAVHGDSQSTLPLLSIPAASDPPTPNSCLPHARSLLIRRCAHASRCLRARVYASSAHVSIACAHAYIRQRSMQMHCSLAELRLFDMQAVHANF